MTQNEIFNFLRIQRICGENKYWRKYEIHQELVKTGTISNKTNKCLTGRKVNMLYAHGFLEIKQESQKFWERSYRLKDKYLKLEDPKEINPLFEED